ncbi:hypothetical protein LZD49_12270 [Dyadobacter sp. CY261]|uniref:hypothetical protein n=1 Tax=Dyadobacter sp. CY261 TaxID=2907203 RepID=UPI001F1B392A|nr:hypothetical protein [Dyadobacter sp. CY261]MCF0071248.1 hypothetical protein [Dyadobacter sp. CY261]
MPEKNKISRVTILLLVLATLNFHTTYAQLARELEKRPTGWHKYYNEWFRIEPKDRVSVVLAIEKQTVGEVKITLQKMYDADQQYRDSLHNGSKDSLRQVYYWRNIMATDAVNQILLSRIIAKYGWPGTDLFGEQGAEIAWYIIWHAEQPYVMKHYGSVKTAFEQGSMKPNYYQSLRDRWENTWRSQ